MHRRSLRALSLALAGTLAAAQTIVLQAETGVLTGNVVVDKSTPGYAGTGYISGFQAADDKVVVPFNVTTAGLYDLTITYAAPYGSKKGQLLLNGSPSGEFDMSATTWANSSAGQVLLSAGANSIGVQNDWGWYFIDQFILSPSPKPPSHEDDENPVNKNASKETQKLLKYLQGKIYGKNKFLTGQQDPASIAWIETNVGVAPAIGGFDLIDYSPSRVEHGLNSTAIEDAIAWDKRGGMVAFCWHWNAPAGLIDQPGKEWWRESAICL
jgi:mannan endo-1,4-beta-mannosidase